MVTLIIFACILLIGIIVVQIGRLTELAARIRGEEEVQLINNRRNANGLVVFMVLFLVACTWSAMYYKNYLLGYGPHSAASAHGSSLDSVFNTTLIFTGIVFFATQIALFWFAYKYKGTKGSKSDHLSHDTRLEVIWTAIPAVVMTFLVIGGLDAWNEVMADVPVNAEAGKDYIEIEATGYQFAWDIRYPGEDGKIGTKNYKLIKPGVNSLGQDWTDEKNWDDFMPSEIVLPVGVPVRVRITSKDVLHNFYLPHFRLKMDAVPGLPTYFVFTPEVTTEEYRERLKNTPEYNVPDPDDPSKMKWETFDYELACAELCGRSHFSMRRIVRIVPENEYVDWLKKQQSVYKTQVRGTENDPNLNLVLPYEVKERRAEFDVKAEAALAATADSLKTVRLKYVYFNTGSNNLDERSQYEIKNIADFLKRHPNVKIELAGHTDNVGSVGLNDTLSYERALAVYQRLLEVEKIEPSRLSAVGYGQSRPVDSNDTESGRANNRRTEFTIKEQ